MMDPNDSDSEQDEDYVPPQELKEDGTRSSSHQDNGHIRDNSHYDHLYNTTPNQSAPLLPVSQQKAVDDAFLELFGKPYHPQRGRVEDDSKRQRKNLHRGQRALTKKKKILSDIFGGSSIASKIIETSRDAIQNDAISRKRKVPLHPVPRKEIITEKVHFAGQTMEIQRSILVGNETEQRHDHQAQNLKKGGKDEVEGPETSQGIRSMSMSMSVDENQGSKPKGIDAVLSQIKGPQKFTTIDKTNVDWENFKDKAGLEEELKKKAQGKDAYLEKKDFLNRVDLRRFEQEREERNRKRAAAASANAK